MPIRETEPGSPAYAEVEQFSPLRKSPWSPSNDKDTTSPPDDDDVIDDASPLPSPVEVIEVPKIRKKPQRKPRDLGKPRHGYANVTIGGAQGKPSALTSRVLYHFTRPSQKDKAASAHHSPSNSLKSRRQNSSVRKSGRSKDDPLPTPAVVEAAIDTSHDHLDINGHDVIGLSEKSFFLTSQKDQSYKNNVGLPGSDATSPGGVSLLKYTKGTSDHGRSKTPVVPLPGSNCIVKTRVDNLYSKPDQDGKTNGVPKVKTNSLTRDQAKTKGLVSNGIKKFEASKAVS